MDAREGRPRSDAPTIQNPNKTRGEYPSILTPQAIPYEKAIGKSST